MRTYVRSRPRAHARGAGRRSACGLLGDAGQVPHPEGAAPSAALLRTRSGRRPRGMWCAGPIYLADRGPGRRRPSVVRRVLRGPEPLGHRADAQLLADRGPDHRDSARLVDQRQPHRLRDRNGARHRHRDVRGPDSLTVQRGYISTLTADRRWPDRPPAGCSRRAAASGSRSGTRASGATWCAPTSARIPRGRPAGRGAHHVALGQPGVRIIGGCDAALFLVEQHPGRHPDRGEQLDAHARGVRRSRRLRRRHTMANAVDLSTLRRPRSGGEGLLALPSPERSGDDPAGEPVQSVQGVVHDELGPADLEPAHPCQ